jgi:hypothetical protein
MRISNLEFHQVIHDIEAENLEEKKSISMIIRQNSKTDVFVFLQIIFSPTFSLHFETVN